MVDKDDKNRRRGARSIAELAARIIDPVTARRGFARSDLIAAWPEIAGPLYADCTAPEKIVWPRGEAEGQRPGVLFLKVDGPKAIFVQHQLPQIIERINAFLGHAAIGHIRIVQAPVKGKGERRRPGMMALSPEAETGLADTLSSVEDDALRAALDRLGRGVYQARLKQS
jgi:hypothetical protein